MGGGASALQAAWSALPRVAALIFGLGYASLIIMISACLPAGIYLQLMGEQAPVDVFA